ncbi:MAG: leucine-rich repeat protein [Bacteroidales bacterium]|nr:leucine-rich repeat protein [Bacteroidales bacterium]
MLALFMSIAANAFFEKNGIYYNITDANAMTVEVIHSYGSDSYSGDIVIPSSIKVNSKVYGVTSIGEYAFQDCSGLTSITIPNSVTSIALGAFEGCTSLTSITIPEGVTAIGNYAFYGSGLTSMTFHCERIDNWFSGIESINEIILGDEVKSIGDGAFQDCYALTSITIPEGVTSIGENAFYGCGSLISMTFHCERIDNWFSGISEVINEIILGNEVKTIGDYAFQNCSCLTSIDIPSSVTSIGGGAFSGCSGLTSIDIPSSVTSIGEETFQGCSGLTSVTIPNSVTSIGYWAFNGCSSLTSITIPESVTSIGVSAFGGTGLTSIDIPSSVTRIEGFTFDCCKNLTSVTIPNSVTSIGGYAFQNCRSLTSITIPEGVTSIEFGAFMNCSSLTSVKVGMENPLSIVSSTFSNRANATLYVPVGSKALYEAADYWKEFKEIVEFSSEPITNLMVVANAINLVKGTSQALTVIPNSTDVTWTSSDASIATVSSDGVVTGVKAGDVTITCTLNGMSSTPFPVHVISIGDVDNDGTISVTDVTTLVNMILGKQ